MRKSKIKQITLAVCLALMPISIFAAGLGKLNVSSGLGEPLKAEIELLSMSPEELSSLVAAVASEEAYTAQGISRLSIHNNIKVELGKSFAGAPILKLRSSLPVVDPYLDMLIQVDWAAGRLQREYTVLLDPPGYQANSEPSAPLAISAPKVIAASPAVVDTPVDNMTDATQISQAPMQTAESAAPSKPTKTKPEKKVVKADVALETTNTLTAEEVTTQRGDTLSSLAKEMQVEGVSLDQMLVALYENNKSAFSGKNMNRLKVGQIIKPPSAEQISSLSAKQASSAVRLHTSNWNDYRNTLAGVVAAAPVAEAVEEKKQATSGKIATAEDKATPPQSAPKDVVKLSAGEKNKAGAAKDKNKEFEEKIAALQEETTAREKSLTEAQERTAALEKQIQDMQKLIALKSQTMATVQNNAADALKPDQTTTPATQTDTVPADASQSSSTEVNQSITDEKSVEIANQASMADETAKPVPVVEKPKRIIPPPVIVEEPSFLESIAGSFNVVLLAGAAALAALGAAWFFFRNKRRKNLDSFERGILTSGGLRANTVFGNTTGATGNSDTSFLTDFAQSADGSMIDTNDVDPIAEAEVYMAYGRDAQAEEILKDAITKEPKRYELHLKLLEMYAARQDTSAFEAIAGELYTTLGVDDPTWIKVAAIGAVMEPGNPLYDASKSNTGAGLDDLATQKLDAADFANVAVTDDLDLDFSDVSPEQSANDAVNNSFAGAGSTGQTAAFNLDDASQQSASSQNNEIDFSDFNIGADTAVAGAADTALDDMPVFSEPTESVANADSNSMDFDLGDFSFGDDASDKSAEKKTEQAVEFDDLAQFSAQNAAPALDTALAMDQAMVQTMDSFPAFDTGVKAEALDGLGNTAAVDESANSFDLPMLEMPEIATPALTPASTDGDAFSLPEINLPEISQADTDAPVANTLDVSFDLPTDVASTDSSITDGNVEEISFDLDLPAIDADSKAERESNALDLEAFMLDNQPAEADNEETTVTDIEPNAFDLSGISLNLDDAVLPTVASAAVASTPTELTAQFKAMPRIDESEDVNIKLDLVAAYIDMEDTEGARELLEEVLVEGGKLQKQRAEQLLNSLK